MFGLLFFIFFYFFIYLFTTFQRRLINPTGECDGKVFSRYSTLIIECERELLRQKLLEGESVVILDARNIRTN